jgi:hypothetical protein
VNLGGVLERFAGHLATALALPASAVSGVVPSASNELPALALSLSSVTEQRAGVGNIPRPTQKAALDIEIAIDLAAPRLVLDGETIELVSDGGHVLQLPTGPVVRRDGSGPPLTADDIAITIGATSVGFTTGAPGPNQFAVDRVAAEALGFGDPETAGVLRFGDALTTGTLRARYHIGQWDVTASRFRGELRVEVFAAAAAAVDAMSRAIGEALTPAATALGRVYELTATSWSAITVAPEPLGTTGRTRALTYRFDFELEEPVVRTGGALISRVKVHIAPPEDEHFDIPNQEKAS